jgi:hypothetical protein
MSETTVASGKGAKGQTHTIPSGSKEILKKKSAELLFDLEKQEFVIVNPSDFPALKRDIEAFDAFKEHMGPFFPTHKVNEKEKAAEIKAVLAVMKEYVDAKEGKESEEILKNLEEKIKEKKKEFITSANIAQGNKMKNGDIKQYLWGMGSKTVRARIISIPTKTVVGHKWKTYKLDTKALNADLAKEKAKKEKKEEGSEKEKGTEGNEGTQSADEKKTVNKILKHLKKPEKEFELNLLEEKLWEGEKTYKDLGNTNFFEEIEQIDSGVSAQMLRVSSEGSVESVVDWKNHKFKSALKGTGTVALLQGKGHFTIYLPDYDGWDVWATLRKIDPNLVKKNAQPLYLAFKANIEGSGFVGACASIGMETGISLGEPKKKGTAEAVAEASLDVFAGAKANAEFSIAGLMKLVSDKEVAEKAEWAVLGSASWGIWGAAGIGLTMGFKVGYWEGRIQYEAKMGVVLKLGAGTSIKGAVNPIKIGQFLYTVAVSVDWLFLSDIFEAKVHSLFQSIMMNCLYTKKTVEDVVKEIGDHLPQIMDAASDLLIEDFGILKNIDDTFDTYVPGYSGFKKHSTAFWLLKSTYHSLMEIHHEKDIKDNAITQTNFIEQTKRWKYASWQMKVNLITDMTQGMSLLSKYSEDDRQKAMLAAFRSARNSKEFHKIYLCITGADDLFSDMRKIEFEQLKARFK